MGTVTLTSTDPPTPDTSYSSRFAIVQRHGIVEERQLQRVQEVDATRHILVTRLYADLYHGSLLDSTT